MEKLRSAFVRHNPAEAALQSRLRGSALEVGLTATAVPDVQDLDQLQPVVNPVVNRVRGVKYLSDAGPVANVNAHAGKRAQDFDMVQKAVTEALGCR
jgi:hypothetical protein